MTTIPARNLKENCTELSLKKNMGKCVRPSQVKSVPRVGGWRWESKLVHLRNKILEDFSTLYMYNDSNNRMPD